jgi:hypothetical protein
MKPVTPFDNFPSFGNAGARQAPGDAKYAQGFLAADTLPAEWANYFFHGSTKGISDLNTAVRSIWLELNSVLTAYNITADASQTDQLYQAIEKRLRSLYPVGTVYQNASNSTNPGDATMLGFGTWEQITDKFLAARGSTNIGASGGAWGYTLTSDNIPQHNHDMNHYHNTESHTHDRGTMEITGDIWLGGLSGRSYNIVVNAGNGALQPSGYGTVDPAYPAEHHNGYGAIHLKASDGWTGVTGGATPKTYTPLAPNTTNAMPNTGNYGSANPTAISITPTYVGVYTWKRTA